MPQFRSRNAGGDDADSPYYLMSSRNRGRGGGGGGEMDADGGRGGDGNMAQLYNPPLRENGMPKPEVVPVRRVKATPYVEKARRSENYNYDQKPSIFNNSFVGKPSFMMMKQSYGAGQLSPFNPGPDALGGLRRSVMGRRSMMPQGMRMSVAQGGAVPSDVTEAFNRFDEDGDGALNFDEFANFVKFWVFDRNKLQCKGSQFEAVVEVLFQMAGGNQYGAVGPSQVNYILNTEIKDKEEKFQEPKVDEADANFAKLPKYQRVAYYLFSGIALFLTLFTGIFFVLMTFSSWPKKALSRIRSVLKIHGIRLLWLAAYIGACVYLFTTNYLKFMSITAVTRITGAGIGLATGNAQLIRFNIFFIFLPLCYRSLVYLRGMRWLMHWVPLDDTLLFHKIVGTVIITASIVHTIGHEINAITIANTTPALLAATPLGPHFAAPPPAFAYNFLTLPGVTGWIMLLVVLIAMPWAYIPALKRRFFNVFYHTHKLMLWVFTPMLIVHGFTAWLVPPKVWYIVMGPLILYFIDRRYRMAKQIFNQQLNILDVRVYPETTVLYIEKTAKYEKKFRPGHYLWICIPDISNLEWHPFTITSACDDPYVSVHIQRSGDWTRRLHNLMSDIQAQAAGAPPGRQSIARPGMNMGNIVYPKCYLDAPIGAPAQLFNTYEVTVMVGAGVGVTPCASIVREMMYAVNRKACAADCILRRKRPHVCCCMIQKLYFVWSTNKQHNLDWFEDTVNTLSEQTDRVEFHHYFTTIKNTKDPQVKPLLAVQQLLHRQTGLDVVSGLRTRNLTHFGRPNWNEFFGKLAARHEGKEVGVFYCGPTVMRDAIAQTLKRINLADNENPMSKDRTVFHFHAEQF